MEDKFIVLTDKSDHLGVAIRKSNIVDILEYKSGVVISTTDNEQYEILDSFSDIMNALGEDVIYVSKSISSESSLQSDKE